MPIPRIKKGFAHPHAYEWHDGHTDHHKGLVKADEQKPFVNEQAAPVGVKTYGQFAQHYGTINPGKKTELKFYPLEGKNQAISDQVGQHGYQVYYAGGKYGKPDLASKNYNTKHLMVYDPDPELGASFENRDYTDSWRKVHELAHAITYPELNQEYGEGRRLGKLGVRTPREAERAVKWEWLAAHKQRDLLADLGVHASDEDFHRELNTVMHDAVHRAVTGQFTEPSHEGFEPHPHKVPLETALNMVREHAASMGLSHPDATLRGMKKSEERGMKIPKVKYNVEKACWEGYEMVGMKEKKGRQVPNCVPKKKSEPDIGAMLAKTQELLVEIQLAKEESSEKKYSKKVKNPETGREKTVRYGAKGYTIAPGTSRGDSYCARSAGQMKDHPAAAKDPNSPLRLSRKKWKCSGKTSRKSELDIGKSELPGIFGALVKNDEVALEPVRLFTVSKLPQKEGAHFHIHSKGDKAGLPAESPSATTYSVRVNEDHLDPRFAQYLFQHAHMSGKFKQNLKGSVIPFVGTKDVERIMNQHLVDLYGKKNG